jgi:stage II sporulation protein M
LVEAIRKNLPFDTMLARSYWIWRRSPALSVPTMLSSSIAVLVQNIFGIFGLALLISLEGTSYLGDIVRDVSSASFEALTRVISQTGFLYIVLSYMIPALILTLVITVLATGFIYSAEYGSYLKSLDGSHLGVEEVMSRFTARWRKMAWTMLLSNTITFSPLIISTLFSLAIILEGHAGILQGLLSLFFLLPGAILTVTLSALLIYTPVAVYAEDISGSRAVQRSIHLARTNLGVSVTYGIVYVLLTAAISSVSSLLPGLGLPLTGLISVGLLILVTPVLHLTKTTIFSELKSDAELPFEIYPALTGDLLTKFPRYILSKFVEGLHELSNFTFERSNLRYHILSASSIICGLFLGELVAEGGLTQIIYQLGYVPGKMNSLVSSTTPISLGVYIFLHNWQVSLATALSGVWFSLPSAMALLLNGVVIGVVSELVPNKVMLLSALLPHGIIEIPSFVLAGSAGIRLGVVFYRFVTHGDESVRLGFYRVTKQTVYIVVGLALLFFVAGLIEGNVTPVIMKMAGWS